MATTKRTSTRAAAPVRPATKARKAVAPAKGRAAGESMTLAEVMRTLEAAGTAQTKKTFLRHGATEPVFGVLFRDLKVLLKRIRVDHDLALALWATGNFDARNLAVKIVDPAKMKPSDLDRWAKESTVAMCTGYVAAVASEGPHGLSRAEAWLVAKDPVQRAMGWSLVAMLAMRDESVPSAWFTARLKELEGSVATATNMQRGTMNQALISIGCRDRALRAAALAAAKRLGPIEVDHGDTACETPVASASIEKAWAHSLSKGFESPAAHERSRESMRLRC